MQQQFFGTSETMRFDAAVLTDKLHRLLGGIFCSALQVFRLNLNQGLHFGISHLQALYPSTG